MNVNLFSVKLYDWFKLLETICFRADVEFCKINKVIENWPFFLIFQNIAIGKIIMAVYTLTSIIQIVTALFPLITVNYIIKFKHFTHFNRKSKTIQML